MGSRSAPRSARRRACRAAAQHERALERLLHRDLLVEREADQQRERIAGDQLVGLVGVGEVQPVGHPAIVAERGHGARCRGVSARAASISAGVERARLEPPVGRVRVLESRARPARPSTAGQRLVERAGGRRVDGDRRAPRRRRRSRRAARGPPPATTTALVGGAVLDDPLRDARDLDPAADVDAVGARRSTPRRARRSARPRRALRARRGRAATGPRSAPSGPRSRRARG